MDYVPTKVGFRPERRVRESFLKEISFPLNGQAPPGLWNRKLEFGAEVVCSHPPTVCRAVTGEGLPESDRSRLTVALEKVPIQRRAFNLNLLEPNPFPRTLFWGEDVAVSVLSGIPNPQLRFRHADASTLCFVHRGRGQMATDFGALDFQEDDFIVLPRGTTYAVRGDAEVTLLLYEFPRRLMRPYHYWIEGYPFVATAAAPAEPVEIVDLPDQGGSDVWSVYVKYYTGLQTRLEYLFSPFDAVAWEGELYPFMLPLKDIRALSSADFHLDPKALTVFVTEDEAASIQTFLPRWVHSLPYPHQNYVTEILFNHRGYGARPEIRDGFLTVHPPGTFHGPDVRALDRQRREPLVLRRNLPWRDEVAVLLESRSPLGILPAAEPIEVKGYESSWHHQYQEVGK